MRDASSVMCPPRVLVRRVAEVRSAVAEALDFLEYDFRNKKVWVKPNLLSPHPPEASVTTDPEVVRRVVRELKARSAAEVWVADNPGGALQGNIETYLAPTGIIAASEGCFRSIAATPVVLKLDSETVPQVLVSRILFESDVILNLPVFKTHALTVLTGAIKNLFGIIPGRQKSLLHGKARTPAEFSELLVDIFRAVPVPVLNIMDALRGMDGASGPNSGRVLSIGRLLASRNAVALDSVFALMAGAKPERIPMLRIAAERGLGPCRSEEIEIVGDFERVPGFVLPGSGITGLGAFLAGGYCRTTHSRPLLEPGLCTECRRCEDSCPADAISMAPLPVIDSRRCFLCYCCVELCPAHALVVRKGLRGLWNGTLPVL